MSRISIMLSLVLRFSITRPIQQFIIFLISPRSRLGTARGARDLSGVICVDLGQETLSMSRGGTPPPAAAIYASYRHVRYNPIGDLCHLPVVRSLLRTSQLPSHSFYYNVFFLWSIHFQSFVAQTLQSFNDHALNRCGKKIATSSIGRFFTQRKLFPCQRIGL